MLIKQIIEVYDILDDINASGKRVEEYLRRIKPDADIEVYTVNGKKGSTDIIKIKVQGLNGKSSGGDAPTIGILGRLGGLGARPECIGFVSDGDGALVALTVAAKLLDMQNKGDCLEGDVFIATDICPTAPTRAHKPVAFMDLPVDIAKINQEEINDDLDAILVVDTTKGNRIINTCGFAISATVKEGYILKVSDDLLDIMQTTTGRLPNVFPLSTQDITPYGNSLYHLNSILQPATATDAPVVGIAVTSEVSVAGCATGASSYIDTESAARFILETAKSFGRKECSLYDSDEFEKIVSLYGKMTHLQTFGKTSE